MNALRSDDFRPCTKTLTIWSENDNGIPGVELVYGYFVYANNEDGKMTHADTTWAHMLLDQSPYPPGSYRNWKKGFREPCYRHSHTGTFDIRCIKIFVYLSNVMLKMGTYFGEFIPVDANHAKIIHLRVLSGQRCVHPMTVPCPACEGRIKSMQPPRFL